MHLAVLALKRVFKRAVKCTLVLWVRILLATMYFEADMYVLIVRISLIKAFVPSLLSKKKYPSTAPLHFCSLPTSRPSPHPFTTITPRVDTPSNASASHHGGADYQAARPGDLQSSSETRWDNDRLWRHAPGLLLYSALPLSIPASGRPTSTALVHDVDTRSSVTIARKFDWARSDVYIAATPSSVIRNVHGAPQWSAKALARRRYLCRGGRLTALIHFASACAHASNLLAGAIMNLSLSLSAPRPHRRHCTHRTGGLQRGSEQRSASNERYLRHSIEPPASPISCVPPGTRRAVFPHIRFAMEDETRRLDSIRTVALVRLLYNRAIAARRTSRDRAPL